MQKSQRNTCKFNWTHWNEYLTSSSRHPLRYVGMVQNMQMNKCNPPNKLTERQLPHDHIIIWRNKFEIANNSSW